MSVLAPPSAVSEAVTRALSEDLGPLGDLTAALIDPTTMGSLNIVTRQPGVIAGQACVVETYAQLDAGVTVTVIAEDGTAVSPGAIITNIAGPYRSLLTGERTALNFLGHLSGVATQTRAMVDAVTAVSLHTKVLDTRKTTPGLRALEKAAVRAGGGTNHRASLSDAILIKDNHLGTLSVSDAVERAQQLWPGRSVEVECDTLMQIREAAAAGATSVLLDNMSPEEAKEAVELARYLAPEMVIEVSGGITLETAALYAASGVDRISSGALTHSVSNLDLGLDLAEGKK